MAIARSGKRPTRSPGARSASGGRRSRCGKVAPARSRPGEAPAGVAGRRGRRHPPTLLRTAPRTAIQRPRPGPHRNGSPNTVGSKRGRATSWTTCGTRSPRGHVGPEGFCGTSVLRSGSRQARADTATSPLRGAGALGSTIYVPRREACRGAWTAAWPAPALAPGRSDDRGALLQAVPAHPGAGDRGPPCPDSPVEDPPAHERRARRTRNGCAVLHAVRAFGCGSRSPPVAALAIGPRQARSGHGERP